MKLAIMDDALNAKARDQEVEWMRQIGASGHLSEVKFQPDDPDAPDTSLMQKIQRFDSGEREPTLSMADISGSLRDFIDRQNRIYRTQQVTFEGARANSEYLFSFVLPGGESTKPEVETLGTHPMFINAHPRQTSARQSPDVPKIGAKSISLPITLSVIANSVEEAATAIDMASRFGFREVWLDTLDPSVLTKAIELGAKLNMPVFLTVRPFEFRNSKDEPSADRTLIGDDPTQSLSRRISLFTPKDKLDNLPPPTWPGPISPVSPGYRARIDVVSGLVKTPGLAGVRLIDVTPDGYNGARFRGRSGWKTLFNELRNYGYCEDLRLAFLRKEGIDPIDLAPREPGTNSDLRQPFFLDDHLRGSWAIYDGTDEPLPAIEPMIDTFDAWLAAQNRTALQAILDAIVRSNPRIPIAVEPIPHSTNDNHGASPPVDWSPGMPVPDEVDPATQRQTVNKQQGSWLMSVTSGSENWIRQTLAIIAAQGSRFSQFKGIIFDFPSLDVKQSEKWIADTFLRG
jgi:hypothetical protein